MFTFTKHLYTSAGTRQDWNKLPHPNPILFIQNIYHPVPLKKSKKIIKIKHDGVGMRNSHSPIFTFVKNK